MKTSADDLNEQCDRQLRILSKTDQIVLYGNTEIAAIMRVALRGFGIKAKIFVFDNGRYIHTNSEAVNEIKKIPVIICGKRKMTRENIRDTARKNFGGDIFEWHQLYYGWITRIIHRDCDYLVLADALVKAESEDDTIDSLCSIVTSKCNLCCIDCDAGIPYTLKPYDESPIIHKKRLNKITTVENILIANLQGGEVLLHKQLSDIMLLYAQNSRVCVITIATNGCVLPSDEICEISKRIGAMFRISDYGVYSKEISKMCLKFDKYNIPWQLYPRAEIWFRQGDLISRGRTESENRKIAQNCFFNNNTVLFEGKMMPCDRTCGAYIRGIDVAFNYVDVDKYFNKKMIEQINKRETLHCMCDYCDYPMLPVVPAIQIER